MNPKINYDLWDLKAKTFFEAACLWYDIDPYNTKDIPPFRKELGPDGWLITTKEDLWSKIHLIESLMMEVAAAKKIKGYELSPYQWMADSPHRIGNEHLRYFAENIVKEKQIPFLSCSSEDLKRLGLSEAVRVVPFFLLTPEERQKHPHMANPPAVKATEEQSPAQQNREDITGEKGDWRVTDFRKWDIEQEFQLEEAAYLYSEADPTGYVENLSDIVRDEEARLFYPAMGTPPVNKACGAVPDKTWEEIKVIYKLLLAAAKKRSLYRPSNGGKLTNGRIHRDDLRYFFAERLGQKPKFLFPEERQGLLKGVNAPLVNKSIDQTPPAEPLSEVSRKVNEQSEFKHSDDFRSVTWQGKQFTFTPRQAQVVQILFDAYENGTPQIGQDYILEKLESPSSRLRDTFKNSPAWDTLIVKGEKQGTYRLNL